jgi:hypothetical protein
MDNNQITSQQKSERTIQVQTIRAGACLAPERIPAAMTKVLARHQQRHSKTMSLVVFT